MLEDVASPTPGNPACKRIANFLMSVYGAAVQNEPAERAVIARAAMMLYKATGPHYWRILDVLEFLGDYPVPEENGLHHEDTDEFKARTMLRRTPPEMEMRIFGRLCVFYRANELRRDMYQRFLIRCAYTTLECAWVKFAMDNPSDERPPQARVEAACKEARLHFDKAQALSVELDQELIVWYWGVRNSLTHRGATGANLKRIWANSDHGKCGWLNGSFTVDASDVRPFATRGNIRTVLQLHTVDEEEVEALLRAPLHMAVIDNNTRLTANARWHAGSTSRFSDATEVLNSDLFRKRLLTMQAIGAQTVPRGSTLVGLPNPYAELTRCPFRPMSASNGKLHGSRLVGWDYKDQASYIAEFPGSPEDMSPRSDGSSDDGGA